MKTFAFPLADCEGFSFVCIVVSSGAAQNEGIMGKRLSTGPALIVLLALLASCSWLDLQKEGYINLSFAVEEYVSTKATSEVPDTNDFILSVTKSDGSVVYSGKYGASPETLEVSPGTYDIRVVSEEFTKPQFSKPQFGDEQCVVVKSGTVVNAALVCRQLNSGMRLKISPTFLTAYPQGLLYLKSSDGKLLYAYKETRIAYFNPGAVSLLLSNSGTESTLVTKSLASQEVLTLSVSVSSTSSGTSSSQVQSSGLSVSVDTTRNWISDSYTIGGTSGGTESDSAMSVADAKESIGEEDVWVAGYIVGGDLTSSSSGISFEAPFYSETNIAIAARSSVSSKSSCMSVQLPSGDVREALNLVDNPDNLGKKVYVKGDIVASYYGLPGIKNVTEYVLK